jgi:hypothetical protein
MLCRGSVPMSRQQLIRLGIAFVIIALIMLALATSGSVDLTAK